MRISNAFDNFEIEYLHYNDRSDSTIENYRNGVSSFINYMGDKRVDEITKIDFIRWKSAMKKQPMAMSSIRSYLSKLKNILEFSNRKGWSNFDTNEIELPHVPIAFKNHLTDDEMQTLVSKAESVRDKAIISLLYASGMRVSEITSLNRSDAGLQFSVIGKGSKQRPCFMDAEAKSYVDLYLKSRTDKSDPMFIGWRGNRLRAKDVQRMVSETARKAGFTRRVTPHLIRHSFATNRLRKGTDIRYIQKMLGHADISTTQLYTHVVDVDLFKIHQQFSRS